jgi:hypothetical protein
VFWENWKGGKEWRVQRKRNRDQGLELGLLAATLVSGTGSAGLWCETTLGVWQSGRAAA